MYNELRIVRSFKWERVPGQEVRYGGGPPQMRLVPTDVLQCLDANTMQWKDVTVVEMDKPPHPHEQIIRIKRVGFNQEAFKKTGAD